MTPPHSMPGTIRPMQLADLPAVFAIEQQAQPFPWPERHFSDSLAAGHHCWVMTAAVGDFSSDPASNMVMAHPLPATATGQPPGTACSGTASCPDAEEAILAYAILLPVVDEIELLTIAVAPAWQHQGLGRRCLHWLMERARLDGMQAMFLEVAAGNRPARRLYQQAGFQDIGQRRNYYRARSGKTDDAWVMRCPLQAATGKDGNG